MDWDLRRCFLQALTFDRGHDIFWNTILSMVMVIEQWVETDRLEFISFPDFATIMIRRK